MHLKTLTLRGFKSFASATTLSFEPGVTCVVGPNGSGKSNVVDALAWVMGEQGAKTLRGGKMEDVIFAGTSGRPPLGRAEVSLTIDNTDGALPIEYAEVTISRTLFRHGGSEYAINGSACRLLDIQDLLSDSGLGREMHVIVGQGQLDAVLRATPEERRGFIEEAAGVLKHRKRKEKALRKLESMQGNLLRLGDLTAEVRRQLGPLGRQAEAARKAAAVQADLRDARARLLADDLAQLTASLAQEIADENALKVRQTETERTLALARARLGQAEQQAALAGPELTRASDNWYALASLRDRIGGTGTLAAERLRLLATPVVHHSTQNPRDLEAQAERARATEAELAQEVAQHQDALDAATARRCTAEERAQGAERELTALVRGAADRREGLARLAGQVAAQQSRVEATAAEIGRLKDSRTQARQREELATGDFGLLETEATGVDQNQADLDADHEAAAEVLESSMAALAQIEAEAAVAERDRSTWAARAETLDLSLTRKDGAGAILGAELPGVLGSMAALLSIDPGYADAIAAALGPVADAVAVAGTDDAIAAIRFLRAEDGGRASLVVGDPAGAQGGQETDLDLPPGAVWARTVVTPAASIAGAVYALLSQVVVVADLAQARQIVDSGADLIVATQAGDLLGAHRAWGGSTAEPSVLHLQAALDEARAAHTSAEARIAASTAQRETAQAQLAAAQLRFDATLELLHESDAAMAAVAERLGQLGATARSAAAEAQRISGQLEAATETLELEQETLDALLDRLDAAEVSPDEAEEAIDSAALARTAAAEQATVARGLETEARLALRTSEERARALAGRAQALDRAAAAERSAQEQADRREQSRLAQVRRAELVRAGVEAVLEQLDKSIARAAIARDAAQARRAEQDAALSALRGEVDVMSEQLRALTDVAHRDEVARTQQQLRLEGLRERAVEELGLDPDVLVEEFGPHTLVVDAAAVAAAAADVPPEGRPYVRAEQEKRCKAAERAMSALGRVNPLALEEFAALEERHKFLSDQLADLKKSRADLMEIVREIDEKVEQVFTEAFRDTEAQFDIVFPRLFPGGEGRLVLTDPSNMLTTGIEVEARPAGKKVKRLSLLSGGERSLTAIALLVSIFKARPSPFYVMDEVEAALDDTNLGRLLDIFVELQRDSQLIVITHQKRTMEIADALYGVTMRGDGVTTVISQRIREPAEV